MGFAKNLTVQSDYYNRDLLFRLDSDFVVDDGDILLFGVDAVSRGLFFILSAR